MPKPTSLTPKRVIAILKQKGFVLRNSSGSHFIFYHPISKRKVIVSYHAKDIPKGTLHSILKQADISEEDL